MGSRRSAVDVICNADLGKSVYFHGNSLDIYCDVVNYSGSSGYSDLYFWKKVKTRSLKLRVPGIIDEALSAITKG